jgi:hypothetical protein
MLMKSANRSVPVPVPAAPTVKRTQASTIQLLTAGVIALKLCSERAELCQQADVLVKCQGARVVATVHNSFKYT